MEVRRHSVAVVAAAVFVMFVVGCTSTRHPAPVSERTHSPSQPGAKSAVAVAAAAHREPDARPEFYTVKRGDTLYLIALDHGLDYKELAEWNNIDNPNVIRGGQQLRLHPPSSSVVLTPLMAAPTVQGKPVSGAGPATATSAAPVGGDAIKSQPKGIKLPYSEQALAQLSAPAVKPAVAIVAAKAEPRVEEKPAATEDDDEKIDWGWPTAGKLLSTFNESTNLKGVAIAGKAGQPIFASAPGKVLYSGDGIRGYGKLVIIKHNKVFLSVYAHNSQVTVKEGQTVVKGQKIAEMGNSDTAQVNLHFEIRRFGKPVDPIKLLPVDRPA
jgi:lipoprotein NlpD